jgi:hypothetical protein
VVDLSLSIENCEYCVFVERMDVLVRSTNADVKLKDFGLPKNAGKICPSTCKLKAIQRKVDYQYR